MWLSKPGTLAIHALCLATLSLPWPSLLHPLCLFFAWLRCVLNLRECLFLASRIEKCLEKLAYCTKITFTSIALPSSMWPPNSCTEGNVALILGIYDLHQSQNYILHLVQEHCSPLRAFRTPGILHKWGRAVGMSMLDLWPLSLLPSASWEIAPLGEPASSHVGSLRGVVPGEIGLLCMILDLRINSEDVLSQGSIWLNCTYLGKKSSAASLFLYVRVF